MCTKTSYHRIRWQQIVTASRTNCARYYIFESSAGAVQRKHCRRWTSNLALWIAVSTECTVRRLRSRRRYRRARCCTTLARSHRLIEGRLVDVVEEREGFIRSFE